MTARRSPSGFLVSACPAVTVSLGEGFGRKRDELPPLAYRCLLQGAHDGFDVIVVALGKGFANGANFLDDWIWGHCHSSISSSGVQITGGDSPAERHVRSIGPRVAALAMCVQFQVRRKSIPWTAATAMCSASTAAAVGTA